MSLVRWQFTIDLQDGQGTRNITEFVKDTSISRKQVLYNKLAPASSSLSFDILHSTAIASLLIVQKKEILLQVARAEGTDPLTSYFKGIIRPTYSIDVTGEGEGSIGSTISLEAVDNSYKLDRTHGWNNTGNLVFSNESICNPENITYSIVHGILLAAGYTYEERSGITEAIPQTASFTIETAYNGMRTDVLSLMQRVVNAATGTSSNMYNKNKNTYKEALQQLLFEYGYSYYFDQNGIFKLYQWGVTDYTGKVTAILDQTDIQTYSFEANDVTVDRVDVDFVATQTDSVGAETKYIPGDLTNPARAIYHNDIPINVPIPDPCTQYMDLGIADYSQIVSKNGVITGHYLKIAVSIRAGGLGSDRRDVTLIVRPTPQRQVVYNSYFAFAVDRITVGSGTSDGGEGVIRLYYGATRNNTVGSILITSIKLYSQYTYPLTKGTNSQYSDTINTPEKIESKYITTNTEAEKLAKWLLSYRKNSSSSFRVKATTEYYIGQYLQIIEPINGFPASPVNMVRVVEKSENSEFPTTTLKWEYAMEPVGLLTTVQTPSVGQPTSLTIPSVPFDPIRDADMNNIIIMEDPDDPDSILLPTSHIFWDKTNSTLKIAGNMYLSGDSTIQGKITAGGLVSSQNYVADTSGWAIKADGNAEFSNIKLRGSIDAIGATLGGYTITSTALYAGTGATRIQLDTTSGIHLGATLFTDAKFRVDLAGNLVANDATVMGVLDARNGSKLGALNVGVDGTLTVTSGSFSINGTSGDATFKGTVQSGSVITGSITATSATISGVTISNGAIGYSNGLFSVASNGYMIATAAKIAGWNINTNEIYSGIGATTVMLNSDPLNLYAFYAGGGAGLLSPFSVTKTGVLKATSATIQGTITADTLTANTGGTIAGWIINSTTLRSSALGTARIELNKELARMGVIDGTANWKVVMGYLKDLPINAPAYSSTKLYSVGEFAKVSTTVYRCTSQIQNVSPPNATYWTVQNTWTASDYGIWTAPGDTLRIDGNSEYLNGTWLIKNDASYLILSGDTPVVRLGTYSSDKGVFLNETLWGGTISAPTPTGYTTRLTPSEFFVGNSTSYLAFDGGLGNMTLKLVTFLVSSLTTKIKGTLQIGSKSTDTVDSLTAPIEVGTEDTSSSYGIINHASGVRLRTGGVDRLTLSSGGVTLLNGSDLLRLRRDDAYLSGYSTDGETRTGYLQFLNYTSPGTGVVVLQSEVGTQRILLNPSGGDVSIGTSALHFAQIDRKVFNINGNVDSLIGFEIADSISGYIQSTATYLAMVTVGLANNTAIGLRNGIVELSGGNLLVGTIVDKFVKTSIKGVETTTPTLGTGSGHLLLQNGDAYGMLFGISSSGNGWIQQQRVDGVATAYDLILQPTGGNVLIGTTNNQSWVGANGRSVIINGATESLLGLTIANVKKAYLYYTGTKLYHWATGGHVFQTDGVNGFSFSNGTSGATATPLQLHLGNTYSNGILNTSLKLAFYDRYGLSVGALSDMQYHSGTDTAGRHDFYINGGRRFSVVNAGVTVDGSVSTTGTINGLSIVNVGTGFSITRSDTGRKLQIESSDVFLNQNLSTTATPTFDTVTTTNQATIGKYVMAKGGLYQLGTGGTTSWQSIRSILNNLSLITGSAHVVVYVNTSSGTSNTGALYVQPGGSYVISVYNQPSLTLTLNSGTTGTPADHLYMY